MDPVDLAKLGPQDLAVARELAEYINPNDIRCVLAFGMKPQTALAAGTKTIVSTSKGAAADEARAALTDLLRTLREAEADTDSANGDRGLLGKLPFIGRKVSGSRRAIRAYEQISDRIIDIEAELRRQQMRLLADYENLDTMFAENADFIEQLEIFIAAGRLKLAELEGQILAAEVTASGSAGNADTAASEPFGAQPDPQLWDDRARAADRLSRRIHDLELTRIMALQTAPQIRLIQDGDERLAAKIQTAVLTSIPLWKRQVAMAISLANQREAVESVKGVADTTNELLRANSEQLKRGTLEVRTQTERGVVDIETLQATTDDLISTVEEALRISSEGREKRAQYEQQIAQMEERLGSTLTEKPDEPIED